MLKPRCEYYCWRSDCDLKSFNFISSCKCISIHRICIFLRFFDTGHCCLMWPVYVFNLCFLWCLVVLWTIRLIRPYLPFIKYSFLIPLKCLIRTKSDASIIAEGLIVTSELFLFYFMLYRYSSWSAFPPWYSFFLIPFRTILFSKRLMKTQTPMPTFWFMDVLIYHWFPSSVDILMLQSYIFWQCNDSGNFCLCQIAIECQDRCHYH